MQPPSKNSNASFPAFLLISVGVIILVVGLWLMLKPSREPEDNAQSEESHLSVNEPVETDFPHPVTQEPEPETKMESAPATDTDEDPEDVQEGEVVPDLPSIGPALCEVEVTNQFQAPLHVYCGSDEISVIAGQSSYTLSDLPEGTELTIRMFAYDVTEPYSYTCHTGYDQITPSGFTLTRDHQIALNNTVVQYIESAVGIYNQREPDRLEYITKTSLSHALAGDLKNEMALSIDKNGYSYIFQIHAGTPEQITASIANHSDDAATVDVTYSIPFNYTETYYYKNGDVKENSGNHTIEHPFVVQYSGAGWFVIG